MKGMILSTLGGVALGAISAKFAFVGGFISLAVWGAAGLAVGYLSRATKVAVINGILYGFFLSFVFMVFVYVGNELVSKLFSFFLLGLFGAFCGLILGLAGAFLRPGLERLLAR